MKIKVINSFQEYLGLVIVLLVGSSLLLTRVSDDVLKNIVASEIVTSLSNEYDLNDIAPLELLTPYLESVIENELIIDDFVILKNVEMNNIVKGKYISIFGRVVIVDKPSIDLSVIEELINFEDMFSSISVNEDRFTSGYGPEEYQFQFEELYTNIPIDSNDSDYKILKLQMTVVYSKKELGEKLESKEDAIIDYVNGYFRDVTVEAINDSGGKEKVKQDLVNAISEIIGDSIDYVLLTQFIIQ